LKRRWPPRRPRGNAQNDTTRKSVIANTDTIIDTIPNETENAIKTDIGTDIAEDTTRMTMDTDTSDRDTHATTMMMVIDRDTHMALTDIAKRRTQKRISPSLTKNSLAAKTPLIGRKPS
jgi:hypothetical protein